MTELEESNTGFDTVGGIIEAPADEFSKYLEGVTGRGGIATLSNDQEKNFDSSMVEGHKLVVEGLEIEYVYGLNPKILDGVWHFQYGISATKNKTDVSGLILHHTSDSPFENYLQYMSRRDEKRGGTFGYHFLIGQDGRVAQTAPLSKRTNHIQPKNNRTKALDYVNNNTVSVSLHAGYRKLAGGAYEHIPASDIQLETAKIIVIALERIFSIPNVNSWGHGEVQSDRMPEEALVLAQWSRGRIGFS